jgi:hypothetical protein
MPRNKAVRCTTDPSENTTMRQPSNLEALHPITILLVAQHSSHVRELQAITASWSIQPRLLWTPLPTQATQLALMHRIDLALLDTDLQDAGANSLERLIARCIPSAQTCTFQERFGPGVSPIVAGQLYWDEMPLVLRAWMNQKQPAQPAAELSAGAFDHARVA